MSVPLPTAVGTGDQSAMIVLLNVPGSVDEARSSAPSTGLADHQGPPIGGIGYPVRTCGRGLARWCITWPNYISPFSSRPSRYRSQTIRNPSDQSVPSQPPVQEVEFRTSPIRESRLWVHDLDALRATQYDEVADHIDSIVLTDDV
jgi:hypothetical protein